MTIARYVRDLEPIERRYHEAMHEDCTDGAPHGIDAHEPFDIDGVTPWADYVAQLERHGLRLIAIEDDLGAAWAEAEAAMPYKRWSVTLIGDWENGWEATAHSRLAGGDRSVDVSTNEGGWLSQSGGCPTAAAALRALTEMLAVPE